MERCCPRLDPSPGIWCVVGRRGGSLLLHEYPSLINSAGGLEAFTQLLQELPSTINMALVLVQHLDPTYKSLLTELLSRTTKLAVEEVTDGTRVKPGHVYVIPPNTTMTISKHVLHLTPRVEVDRRHTPIDQFLESLAQ